MPMPIYLILAPMLHRDAAAAGYCGVIYTLCGACVLQPELPEPEPEPEPRSLVSRRVAALAASRSSPQLAQL
jgi:hypothetical protein